MKSMPFKGGTRLWSNRYHFNGGTPADDTHWHTLFDNIVTGEKAALCTTVTIVECFGYAAGSDVPVSSKTYSTAGTHVIAGVPAPGECAALLRWSTSARSTKNHPVYLFNYFHACDHSTTTTTPDILVAGQRTAIDNYAAGWITGFSDGTTTHKRSRPDGNVVTGSLVETQLTHRDLPH